MIKVILVFLCLNVWGSDGYSIQQAPSPKNSTTAVSPSTYPPANIPRAGTPTVKLPAPVPVMCYPSVKVNAINMMRLLWEDHVMWTRLYLVSAQANLPDKSFVLARLLENQKDIGTFIALYYGRDAGRKLTDLLTDHIVVAGKIIDDLLTNKSATANLTAWRVNGDEIAAFLSNANPKNWPLADMKAMMKHHLDTTVDEVVAHTSRKWADSVKAYDAATIMILDMADHLSMGIFKQFPEKFKE